MQAEASPGSFGAALHFRVYRPHRYRFVAPRAESADAFITMGLDEDLDDAVKGALGEMIKLITERTGVSASDVSRIAASQPGPP
jgi:acetamidase/formamidase